MNKFLRAAIRAISAVISLFRKETSEEGKAFAKSGVASLTIAGLISSGRLAFQRADLVEDIFTAHHLANITLVILGIITASAASQLQLVLEKVENILSVDAKYTHANSVDGKKLSEAERPRVFDLFLRELRSLGQEFGSGIFARIGKGVQSLVKAAGLRP